MSNQKKILFLSNASGYGGSEKSLELLVEYFSKKYRCVVCVENEMHKNNLQGKNNIEIISLKKGNDLLSVYSNLKTLYKLFNDDIHKVLINTNKGALYVAVLSFLKKLILHDFIICVRDNQWKYALFIFKQLSEAKFAIPSEALQEKKDYIRDCIDVDNIYVIGEPVIICPEGHTMRESHILMLANIARLKGIEYCIQAFARTDLYKKGIKLLVCGSIVDDKYYAELNQYKARLACKDKIEFRTFQENVDELYKKAYVVVNTTVSQYGGPESFGRTIIEAWQHKKPVIAFSVGGPKYIINGGYDGFLINEKNVEELSKMLVMLCGDDDLRRKTGLNGYRKVRTMYQTDIICKKIESIWNE